MKCIVNDFDKFEYQFIKLVVMVKDEAKNLYTPYFKNLKPFLSNKLFLFYCMELNIFKATTISDEKNGNSTEYLLAKQLNKQNKG